MISLSPKLLGRYSTLARLLIKYGRSDVVKAMGIEEQLRREEEESESEQTPHEQASSGAEALEAVQQLLQRGSQVALFLVDERMPQMSGTQFLLEAIKLYPEARRVLLTAYADTDTAITAINQVGLDHYLLKPWEPPTVKLYPVLEDLLSEWYARARPAFDGIQVVGTALSPASFAVKDFLASNQVPYQWRDPDEDAEFTPGKRIRDLGDLTAHGGGPIVEVELEVELDGLPSAVDSAVYRLAQESVTNARRHARHAGRVCPPRVTRGATSSRGSS